MKARHKRVQCIFPVVLFCFPSQTVNPSWNFFASFSVVTCNVTCLAAASESWASSLGCPSPAFFDCRCMDCKNCELKKRQFICENCLRTQSVYALSRLQCLTQDAVSATFAYKRSTSRKTATSKFPRRPRPSRTSIPPAREEPMSPAYRAESRRSWVV